MANQIDGAAMAYRDASAAEVAQLIDDGGATVVVDVRSASAWQASHLPGAVNIPFNVFSTPNAQTLIEAALPEKDARMVVYCYVGVASVSACKVLASWGYTNLINLKGGHTAWCFN